VAKLSIRSVINDDRWAFVGPLLPNRRRRPPDDLRAEFAAVVCAVTTDSPWDEIPEVFGVLPSTAQRRFVTWTDADLWRRLAVTALDTPHAHWACTVADAAIHRAGKRAHGYPNPYPKDIPDEVDEPTCAEPAEPEPPSQRTRPTTHEFAEARRAMNRPDGTAS
jgi:transposase